MSDLPPDLLLPTCPGCDAPLEDCVGEHDGGLYEAVRCRNGCDLWAVYT